MGQMSTHEALNAATFSSDDERWAAVGRRDRSADGAFYYSVRTTGVYCRPFEELVARVVGFVEAPAPGLNLPLDREAAS